MRLTFSAGFILTVLALGACDTGLQGKLNEARDKRYAAARAAVYKVEDERLTQLDKVPAPDAEFVGDEHPLLKWRKQLLERTDDKRLMDLSGHARPTEQMQKQGLNIGVKGTPSQISAELAAAYIRESNQYWSNSATMSRYSNYLRQYFQNVEAAKAQVEAKQAEMAKNPELAEDAKAEGWVPPPLLDEARFDQVFMHAVKYFNLAKLVERSQSYASTMSDYEIAFDFPGRGFGKESFSDYVSRICFMHEALKERCGKIPHEFRAAVVDRAYLEWLLGRLEGLKLENKDRYKRHVEVTQRLAEAVKQAIAAPLETKEEPVFPSTFAEVSGMSGIEALFSDEQGVQFNAVKLADKFGGTLPAQYAETVKKAIEDIKNTPGNRLDYQRVVLRMPGNVPFGTVLATVKSFPADTVKQVFLVGRRRVDESMRLAALAMRLPRPDDSQTMSYQFKEDGDKKTQCNLAGVLGEPMIGKRDEFYVHIVPEKIRATQVTTTEGENPEKIPGDTVELGTPADLTKILEFLESKSKARVRLFLGGKYSYDEAVQLVTKLLYKCEDEEYVYNDPKKAPVKRTCGKVKGREITLILGMCE